ncbi:MAG: alanine racemase [Acidobacteria bacterium]|nr:alanine racemase [Acidobacteriota bacterium]
MRPTWAEIDTDAFSRNVDAIVARLPERARLVAVLKADGYGHGAIELAKRCTRDRVAMIATALLEEALELRGAGIDLPLLVLGPLRSAQIPIALDRGITIGVIGPEELASVCEVARHRDVTIHLKLDSGMGRMGAIDTDLQQIAELIGATPRLHVAAIYTHFANAGDPDDPFTEQQLGTFRRMVETLRTLGVEAPLHHTANSAATMRGLIEPGGFVRVGIALYGGEAMDVGTTKLESVMRWRTEIARLKTLPLGHAVGYGTTFWTPRETRLATLPVGYADGYDRLLSNNAEVLVRGRRAPIVGRVSMDLVTVDVTDVAGVAVGDEVVLLGEQGGDRITAEELAEKIGTISYEVLCNVSARVPRLYRTAGSPEHIRSRFNR